LDVHYFIIELGYDATTIPIHTLQLTIFFPSHQIKMKHVAAYLLLVLGGNESPSADDVTAALSAVGVEADADSLGKFLAEMDGKSLDETIAAGKEMLAKFGGGGGGAAAGGAAGGDAAAEEEEEEEVEEEAGMEDAIDMFGGDEGGDY
jgi:large subunit ribosomal protein LP2